MVSPEPPKEVTTADAAPLPRGGRSRRKQPAVTSPTPSTDPPSPDVASPPVTVEEKPVGSKGRRGKKAVTSPVINETPVTVPAIPDTVKDSVKTTEEDEPTPVKRTGRGRKKSTPSKVVSDQPIENAVPAPSVPEIPQKEPQEQVSKKARKSAEPKSEPEPPTRSTRSRRGRTSEEAPLISSPNEAQSTSTTVEPPVEPKPALPTDECIERLVPKLRVKAYAGKSVVVPSQSSTEMAPMTPTKPVDEAPKSKEIKPVEKSTPDTDTPVTETTAPVKGRGRRGRRAVQQVEEHSPPSVAVQSEQQQPAVPTPSVVEEEKPTSRSRKRRISDERPQRPQSSDSDGFDDRSPIAEFEQPPATPDSDVEEQRGGKRAKMRGKHVDVNVRKEVETKKLQEIQTSSASEDDPAPKRRGRWAKKTDPEPAVETSFKTPDKVTRGRKGKRPSEPEPEPEATTSEMEIAHPKDEPVADKSADTDDSPKAKSPDYKKPKVEKEEEPEPSSVEAKVTPPPVATKSKGGRPRKAAQKTASVEKEEPAKPEETPKSKETEPQEVPQSQSKPEPETKPSTTQETPKKTGRKRQTFLEREVDTNLVLPTSLDTPVRQSRRIAQQKIREEADRRKMEEVMLAQMKRESEKKKRQEAKDVDFVPDDDSDEEDSKDSKKRRKKGKKDRPWATSSEDSEDDHEDEEEEHEHSDDHRSVVKSDHEFSCESDVDDGQAVPVKRARTVKKEDQSDSDDDNPDHACQTCKKIDHPEWILLCDSCDKGYHCSCLKPVLFLIPEGDWFCPTCQHAQLIQQLEGTLEQFDVKTKEFEEAEKERIKQQEEEEKRKV